MSIIHWGSIRIIAPKKGQRIPTLILGQVLGLRIQTLKLELVADDETLKNGTLRLLAGSWACWRRVSALGARVWDLTRRVQGS